MQQRLSGIQVNGQTLLDNIAYAPFGPVSGWIWGNGQQSQRSYDANGRLQRFDIGTEQRNLSYDKVGNITALVGATVNQQFGYDALQRLTAANSDNFELGYAYDANGNRTAVQDSGATQTYLTAPGSNRLAAIDAMAYQYDANGNTLSDGNHQYAFDASNRLVAVDGGMTARYGYDAFGQRVEKTATQTYQLSADLNGDGKVTEDDIHVLQEYVRNHQSPPEADLNQDGQVDAKDTPCIATLIGQSKNQGKAEAKGNNGKGAGGPHACHVGEWITATRTTQFVYDGPNLLGEYEASGKAQQETVWIGGTPVATLKDGQLYAVHTDQLGAPRALTDANGTVVWRWEPAPFGDTPVNDDPDGDGSQVTYNLRFPGQYYDGETGNHYNYYRDYNPSTGRYIESDPIGLDGGLNTYGYVGGSPLSNIDPTGQFLTSVDAACMHDPQFCVEVMGQMAKNSAAMSGDPCLEEAAERLTDAAEKMAIVGMVTGVVKHVASGVAKGTGPYKQFKGHHVHAKAGFKDVMAYDAKEGFSISQSFMKKHGIDHAAMTRYQRQAFKELAQSGRANTLKEHTRIAVEALIAGGASREMARKLVAQSLNALRNSGVREPTNIPWYR